MGKKFYLRTKKCTICHPSFAWGLNHRLYTGERIVKTLKNKPVKTQRQCPSPGLTLFGKSDWVKGEESTVTSNHRCRASDDPLLRVFFCVCSPGFRDVEYFF